MASPPPRKNFDRFIYYFSGVAIGCVMLGVLSQARSCQVKQGSAMQASPPQGVATPEK
jgi:hypothetical protein